MGSKVSKLDYCFYSVFLLSAFVFYKYWYQVLKLILWKICVMNGLTDVSYAFIVLMKMFPPSASSVIFFC